jgi:hypothetical protein
MIQI